MKITCSNVPKRFTARALSIPRLCLTAVTPFLFMSLSLVEAGAQKQQGRPRQRVMEDACLTDECRKQTRGRPSQTPASGRNIGHGTRTVRTESPFIISIDGETAPESGNPRRKTPARSSRPGADPATRAIDRQRRTDLDLSAVDIQVKFDGLEFDTQLNVSTVPIRRTYRAGERINFLPTSNYPAFIARAEIRIYEQSKQDTEKPLFILPVTLNREISWMMPAGKKKDFVYILRVYDIEGRFDETEPLTLARTDSDFPAAAGSRAVAPGMGEDRTAVRNIPVRGGAVTVFGRNIPQGSAVESLGERVPLDPSGRFVIQRIMPPGDHRVDVAVNAVPRKKSLRFNRDINIPYNDWFYVGLADVTFGKRMGNLYIEEVRPGEYETVYKKGRVAFYLKGKVKGKYLLTAAADTTEDGLRNIFRNMDRKDARRLLRRLDPDDYYPVYGDDSMFVEDAPTRGRFYVRLERGDSHIIWGTQNTRITGVELMRSERMLYGANTLYRSQDMTPFGERRTEATAYGAQPDTLSQREEFLATGGSAYFMKRQDISRGSETVSIETRDELSGRVIERRTLRYGEDYSFDYMQGVLLLQRPLSSTTGTTTVVREGALGGQKIYVLVNYEYMPAVSDIDGYVYGGRVQRWMNDSIRIGVTGMSETTGPADQRAVGADIRLRYSEKTVFEAEIARSKGPGFSLSRSTDGGLSWTSRAPSGNRDRAATSWRVRGQAGLEDIFPRGNIKGTVGGYYEDKKAGFASLSEEIVVDQKVWGSDVSINVNEWLDLKLNYDDFSDAKGQAKRKGSGTIKHRINDFQTLAYGLRYTKFQSPRAIASGKSGYNGSRLDGGLRYEYRWDNDRMAYVFGQGTLQRSGDIHRNDRAGVGGEMKLTDKISATGEASYGTHGLGGLASINYNPTADDHYYLGYKLDPDRAFELDRYYHLHGTDMGAVVAGMKRRINEAAATYSENSYDMFGRRRSLTQAYGVVYTPDAIWTVNGSLEMGRIRDRRADSSGLEPEDFNRYAPSLAIGYRDEEAGITAHARGEMRFENSPRGTRDLNSFLLAGGFSVKTADDWRLLTNINAVVANSKSRETAFRNTDYIETSVGYAYRPIENDRLNGLFKYTWLHDKPGNHQLVGGYRQDYYAPAQRSHIISSDFTYDLFPWLSVGAKYGVRFGDVKYRTAENGGKGFADQWQRSTAHLGVIRTDLHLIRNWDMLLEGRVMHMSQARTTDFGLLTAIYRHIGDNFKFGVGYNFGRFSDDLRDHRYNDRGLFINLIGKF